MFHFFESAFVGECTRTLGIRVVVMTHSPWGIGIKGGKMKKSLIPAIALGLVAVLASCNTATATYTRGVNLNYVLLIGQIDHNDSANRTAGIRDALGTRAATHLTNPNTESPVVGTKTFGGVSFTVTEIEHAEQRNTSGATWDQQTAHDTAETWISKHTSDSWKETDGSIDKAQGIQLFVSNNDGMAVGAIGASNWVSGMPIFGYDSNADALQYIKDGKIMGTINQNASDQAAGIFMTLRNAMDGLAGADIYTKGFSTSGDYGKITAAYAYSSTNKSLLVNNFSITAANVDQYLGKSSADLIDTGVTKKTGGTTKNVFLSIYSATDTFLHSNVLPLMALYEDKFNINYTKYEGDGNSDGTLLDNITQANAMDGYAINMVKTTSTESYLDKIATKVGATAASPTSVPVVFWNRQGTLTDGSVDTASMADSRFRNIFYVGFDSAQGGTLQGQMIANYLAANVTKFSTK